LKERLFGLINSESNHGEDVKEYYFYLGSTPTHSYMKLHEVPFQVPAIRTSHDHRTDHERTGEWGQMTPDNDETAQRVNL